jgi:hypothetical protein
MLIPASQKRSIGSCLSSAFPSVWPEFLGVGNSWWDMGEGGAAKLGRMDERLSFKKWPA